MRKLVALSILSIVAVLVATFIMAGAANAAPSAAMSSSGTLARLVDTRAGAGDVPVRSDLATDRGSAVSVWDMLEMEMAMNHLSQLAEMANSVVGASNASTTAMARGLKADRASMHGGRTDLRLPW